MSNKTFLVLFFGLFSLSFLSQELKQSIRGVITNSFTEQQIQDVHVALILNQKIIAQTISNQKGTFVFDSVELGTYDISFSHVSYLPYTLPNVIVYSKKECIVNAQMEFSSYLLDEALIEIPEKERGITNNTMASVSAYSIRVEDAQRLAGALDDPIRAAGTLPGVTSDAAFSENFISIRGNSPRGLKYQMNGIELANPTHFARIGSSGGTFTIFSMQLLDNSDFFSGAFPAEYSNALAGVFDVKFRKGNTEKNEYTVQLGTLGLDFAAEGPLQKKNNSSFLFNYRYATVGMARLIGYPTEPTYQDLSFNLNFPFKKGGALSLYAISGTSDRARIAELDSLTWKKDVDRYNLSLVSNMVTLGANYTKPIGENTVFNAAITGSYTNQIDNKKYITDDYLELTRNINEYNQLPLSIAGSFKHLFSLKHSNKTGFSYRTTRHNWLAQKYNFTSNNLDTIVNGIGNSATSKIYTQSKFDITKKWRFVAGVNLLHFNVNDELSIEPRTGLTYQLNQKNQLSLAYGLHSQIENYAIYQTQIKDSIGTINFPNKKLNFAKAHHYVLSYKTKLIANHHLRIEAYYQDLSNIPTEANGSYSTVNIGELDDIRSLTNGGEAENYGVDIGLERYAEGGLYYMINTSIFESNYTGGDGIRRSTEYDYGYNIRFLAGKNYMIGEKKNKKNYIGWNTNVSLVGGAPYTPLDLEQSKIQQETVLNESLAFSEREDDLLFIDVTLTYKINKPKYIGIWSLQIKNIFSNGNAIYREYDAVLDQAVTIPSSSFFPNLSYKVQF
ncbi:MAG: carboxypeptidase regulatory-like domain-containing protein [Flavobacteriales bacterium]|jgi:hypothetical protein|nr:carboxypeptidase regulatory-like domain-containing protein [Flavobacteriales bacterium]